MYKIALVEYLNSIPFVKSIEQSGLKDQLTIIKANPKECANLFRNGEVDIALLPIGAIQDDPEIQIITDYCIGCEGAVRTVCIYSDLPFDQITSIREDSESRTSNLLIKVLNEHHWSKKQNISIVPFDAVAEASLLIGDKALMAEKKYKYVLDLGLAWKKLTGLPFVFAVWVCRPTVDPIFIKELNGIFKDFLETEDLFSKLQLSDDSISNLKQYFEKNISYQLDDTKKTAMKLFLEYTKNI